MIRASTAYPQISNRQYMKYAAMAVGMCFLFAFFSDTPSDNEVVPGMAAVGDSKTELNLRGQRSSSANLSELIAVGLGLTAQAAKIIKDVKAEHKEDLKVKGLTKEGVEEPVTVADTKSNLVFVNGYRNHFEGINILSEETEPEKATTKLDNPTLPDGLQLETDPSLDLSEVLIIVDPLDATKEFGENLLNFVTTMVCIVHKGKPIAGIINQVFEEEKPPVVGVIPLGADDEGVLFNRVKKAPVGEAARTVTISRSHTGEGGNVVQKYLEGHKALMAGGAGYKSLLVLDGEAEAYIHVTAIKSWDVCAAEAVMKASGGGFSDIAGNPLVYPMTYDSTHSEALFKNGIVATASKEQQAFFVEKLDGNLA